MATAYRTVVMLGILVVGSMGWVVYGPPPEKLGPAIDRVANWVKRTAGADTPSPDALQPLNSAPLLAAVPLAPEFMPEPIPPITMLSAPPASDPFASTASFTEIAPPSSQPIPAESMSSLQPMELVPMQSLAPVAPADTNLLALPEIAPIAAQLAQAGLTDCQLQPWGGAEQLFRCWGSIPVAGDSGLRQQFEATAATPTGAVKLLAEQIESWRNGQLRPISE
jgi:hypothetical protein